MDPYGPLIPRSVADPRLPWMSTPLAWQLGIFSGKLAASSAILLEMKSNMTVFLGLGRMIPAIHS